MSSVPDGIHTLETLIVIANRFAEGKSIVLTKGQCELLGHVPGTVREFFRLDPNGTYDLGLFTVTDVEKRSNVPGQTVRAERRPRFMKVPSDEHGPSEGETWDLCRCRTDEKDLEASLQLLFDRDFPTVIGELRAICPAAVRLSVPKDVPDLDVLTRELRVLKAEVEGSEDRITSDRPIDLNASLESVLKDFHPDPEQLKLLADLMQRAQLYNPETGKAWTWKDIHKIAAKSNVAPWGYTLKELFWRAEAVEEEREKLIEGIVAALAQGAKTDVQPRPEPVDVEGKEAQAEQKRHVIGEPARICCASVQIDTGHIRIMQRGQRVSGTRVNKLLDRIEPGDQLITILQRAVENATRFDGEDYDTITIEKGMIGDVIQKLADASVPRDKLEGRIRSAVKRLKHCVVFKGDAEKGENRGLLGSKDTHKNGWPTRIPFRIDGKDDLFEVEEESQRSAEDFKFGATRESGESWGRVRGDRQPTAKSRHQKRNEDDESND